MCRMISFYTFAYIYRICHYRKHNALFCSFLKKISLLYYNVSFSNCSLQSTKYLVDLSMSIHIDIAHSFLSAEQYSIEKTSIVQPFPINNEPCVTDTAVFSKPLRYPPGHTKSHRWTTRLGLANGMWMEIHILFLGLALKSATALSPSIVTMGAICGRWWYYKMGEMGSLNNCEDDPSSH